MPEPSASPEALPTSRPRVVSWFPRPKTPPVWLGIVVAAGLIAAYYVVAELLTNVAKYAQASVVGSAATGAEVIDLVT